MSVAEKLLFLAVAVAFWAVYGWFRTAKKERQGGPIRGRNSLTPRQTYGAALVYLFVVLLCILWLPGVAAVVGLAVWTVIFCALVVVTGYSKAKRASH